MYGYVFHCCATFGNCASTFLISELYQYTFHQYCYRRTCQAQRQATIMSKARPSKRKEEYMPSDEIKDFRNEILKAGMHLASVSSVSFPNAESVSNAISRVLSIVEQYELVGRWVTSRVSKSEKEYVTTKEIRHVSSFAFFLY
jgi:hypothetical protein